MDAADTAEKAAKSMTASAARLGSLIAEAVADAAQKVMSGKWPGEEAAPARTASTSRPAAKRKAKRSTARKPAARKPAAKKPAAKAAAKPATPAKSRTTARKPARRAPAKRTGGAKKKS
jgi:hypothetical protein